MLLAPQPTSSARAAAPPLQPALHCSIAHATHFPCCPQAPSLTLAKAADAPTVSTGERVGFTLTLTNAGPGSAKAVTLTDDPLPPNPGLAWAVEPAVDGCSVAGGKLSCSFESLAAGEVRTVHLASPTSAESGGTLSNQATAAAGNLPHGCAACTASAATVVQVRPAALALAGRWIGPPAGRPALRFSSASPAQSLRLHLAAAEPPSQLSLPWSDRPQAPALSLAKSASLDAISMGDNVTFTLTATNAGPGIAKAVLVSDPLHEGFGIAWSVGPADPDPSCSVDTSQVLRCGLGDLAPAQSRTLRLTAVTGAKGITGGGELRNEATVSAANLPPGCATCTASAAIAVQARPGRPACLASCSSPADSSALACSFTRLAVSAAPGLGLYPPTFCPPARSRPA